MPVRKIALTVGFLLAGLRAMAQITTGSIAGNVLDPQGAVIPNAKVTLTNTAQGAASAREFNTSGEGTFLFTPVLPGTYTLTVEVTGFKKYTGAHETTRMDFEGGADRCRFRSGFDGRRGS